ncbi:hypothetical protein JRQ81_006555 [Phrynocephalus forsythii]|uniref:Uncharacterized protein n=1 Tax=Phrynocephalus forsythii TaxID=171643 RepID=A0A9Q1B754_9SAUR|nr:hypothetical protein JRQ81_006555 [Phrynocephalus forsythii]
MVKGCRTAVTHLASESVVLLKERGATVEFMDSGHLPISINDILFQENKLEGNETSPSQKEKRFHKPEYIAQLFTVISSCVAKCSRLTFQENVCAIENNCP